MITNSKNRTMVLIFLVLIFLTITLLVANKNSFVINTDNTVHSLIENNQFPSVYNFMLSITNVGDVLGSIVIFLVFGLFLILKNKKFFYIFTLAASSGIILTETIKHIVQRARPYNLIEQGFSFPSAHAMISTVFLLSSIFLLAPLMKKTLFKNIFLLATSAIFIIIAFSRIYLSVHFTSDVVASIFLGLICFLFAEIVCCHKKENVL